MEKKTVTIEITERQSEALFALLSSAVMVVAGDEGDSMQAVLGYTAGIKFLQDDMAEDPANSDDGAAFIDFEFCKLIDAFHQPFCKHGHDHTKLADEVRNSQRTNPDRHVPGMYL